MFAKRTFTPINRHSWYGYAVSNFEFLSVSTRIYHILNAPNTERTRCHIFSSDFCGYALVLKREKWYYLCDASEICRVLWACVVNSRQNRGWWPSMLWSSSIRIACVIHWVKEYHHVLTDAALAQSRKTDIGIAVRSSRPAPWVVARNYATWL